MAKWETIITTEGFLIGVFCRPVGLPSPKGWPCGTHRQGRVLSSGCPEEEQQVKLPPHHKVSTCPLPGDMWTERRYSNNYDIVIKLVHITA